MIIKNVLILKLKTYKLLYLNFLTGNLHDLTTTYQLSKSLLSFY